MALIMRLPLPSHKQTSTRQRGEEVNGLRSRRGAQKGPALTWPSFCVSHRIISDSQGGREESSSGSCYVLCPLPRVLHPFPHFLDDLLLHRASVTDCHATSLAWSSRQISGLGSWKARSLDLALTPCSYGTSAKRLPISGTQFGHLYSENVGKEFPGSVLVATVR